MTEDGHHAPVPRMSHVDIRNDRSHGDILPELQSCGQWPCNGVAERGQIFAHRDSGETLGFAVKGLWEHLPNQLRTPTISLSLVV
ncbi:hypothetical protein NCH01_14250 [Neoasaia chiangmaiensis]|nr:hypothetical protein NCH01_14250 [Neoasaia chiangmaiensis]